MKTSSKPRPKKRAPRTDKFHVSIRRRKHEPACIQLKFGNHLIHECHPHQMQTMLELADKWNTSSHDVTNIRTLRTLQLEAAGKCE